jgi:DNA-binding protein H-NS
MQQGQARGYIPMKDSQLQKMSYKDMLALKTRIEGAIRDKEATERIEIRNKMEQLARQAGFSVSELFGNGRRKGGKVAPKYRNPKNPDQTWTGRGRRPRWIAEVGGDLKRFLIT